FSGGDDAPLASFLAFGESFGGDVSVAAGDVDGDGLAEAVVGGASGGPSHVKAFGASGDLREGFYACAANYLGGVRLATADANGDGRDEVFTASAAAADADVRGFDALTGQAVEAFYSYGDGFRRGLTLG